LAPWKWQKVAHRFPLKILIRHQIKPFQDKY